MGALVVLAAQAGSIEPGAEAETVVLVRNTGEEAGEFFVAVRGAAAPWAVVEPQILRLEPGEEAPAWVRFRPPRAPSTRPGVVPFDVVVTSRYEPDFEVSESAAVEVGTYSAVRAELVAPPSVGARWTEFALAVRNAGNREVTVSVDAEAGGRDVALEVEPADVRLAAGDLTEVQVRVRPPRRLLPHRSDDRKLTIAVVSDGGALATVRTEFPEEASLGSELYRSARVLVVLLVLLAAGGLALLRSDDDGTVDVTQGAAPAAPVPSAPPASETPAPEPAPEAAAESVPADSPAARDPVPALPKMVFVRIYGPDERDIVVREAGTWGSELRLRTNGALESRPRLSPDGGRVAFVQEQGATWKVCVSRSSGGGSICSVDATAGSSVAWSPDGKTLYHSRASRLYASPVDATGRLGAERDLGLDIPNSHFALSPDGTRVAHAEGQQIVVRPVGGGPGVRINVRGDAEDPAWSPDGSRLVYTSGYQLFVAPAGGGPIRQLTAAGTVNGEAAWTPDGWIVFRSNRSGNGDLFALQADGAAGSESGIAVINETEEREVTPSF